MNSIRGIAAALLVVALTTCDHGPKPGWLLVRLSGPTTDDAGVLLTVGGGPIDSVRSAFPVLYTARSSASWRLLVAGDRVAGVVAEIWVPDVGEAVLYSGSVEQIAAAGSLAQRDPAGYRLSLQRP